MEHAGERLKKIRLEKGLSLEEVHKHTKVHLNILRAIEGDGLTDLKPVYLKGFLKIYCKFLGVDSRDYIEEYRQAERKEEVKLKPQHQPAEDKQEGPSFAKSASLKLGSFRPSKKFKKAFVLSLIAVLLIFGFLKLSKVVLSKAKDKKQAPIAPVAAVVRPEPAPVKLPKKEEIDNIRLVIRAQQNCWVSLEADDKVVFQRVLEKGRFETWQAKDRFELSLGNAGGVELEVNGQLFKNLGRYGQVRKNIVITKEGINIAR